VQECVDLVQEQCEWANIANVDANALVTGEAAECWCQKGNDVTPDDSSKWLNCWFGESGTNAATTPAPVSYDGANAVNGGVVAMVFGFVVLIMG